MSASFVPIEQSWHEGGALVVLGSAHLAAGDPGSSSMELAEMASGDTTGTVEVDVLAGGQVQLIARVVDHLAAEKCRKQVYSGFAITTVAAADGSTRLRRVALVDSPAGFGKSALLKIGKAQTVTTKSSILCARPEVALMVHQARQRKAEEQRIAKAQAIEAALVPCAPTRAGMAQHQGTGDARRDRAAYGQDQGGNACMDSIRRMLAMPYREGEGLVSLLRSRAA